MVYRNRRLLGGTGDDADADVCGVFGLCMGLRNSLIGGKRFCCKSAMRPFVYLRPGYVFVVGIDDILDGFRGIAPRHPVGHVA